MKNLFFKDRGASTIQYTSDKHWDCMTFDSPEHLVRRLNDLLLSYWECTPFSKEKPIPTILMSINDDETLDTISKIFEKYHYISDPHTATGLKILMEKNSDETWVSLVCAHPAKFNEAVEKAVQEALNDGLRTKDIMSDKMKEVSTSQMGDAIISKLQ